MLLSSRGPASALASTSARSSSGASSARLATPIAHAPAAKQRIPAFSRTRSTTTATKALDDTVLSAAAASADAAKPIYDIDDPVITAVFSVAIVALSVLTLGVAYLSLTSWIDSRNEEAERKRAEAAERSRALNPSQRSVPRRKAKAADALTSRGGGKGFSK